MEVWQHLEKPAARDRAMTRRSDAVALVCDECAIRQRHISELHRLDRRMMALGFAREDLEVFRNPVDAPRPGFNRYLRCIENAQGPTWRWISEPCEIGLFSLTPQGARPSLVGLADRAQSGTASSRSSSATSDVTERVAKQSSRSNSWTRSGRA